MKKDNKSEKNTDWELKLYDNEKAILKKMRSRAKLYDSGIDLGFTKVGIDPILGLVPGVGDILTSALALQLAFSCKDPEIEIPSSVIHKMYFNVIIDFSLGFIPILGDVGDFMFKCNDRNLALFEDALKNRVKDRPLPPPPVPEMKGSALQSIVGTLKGKLPAMPGASKSKGPGK
ncbi:MAG: hypothetical protein J3Q66DRAFT_342308 [Benniella sp.]|nr:MAG: hypothetical protein J3Q66DRAFT_342308 [Benniella sp.]